jgi:hypothetical protein
LRGPNHEIVAGVNAAARLPAAIISASGRAFDFTAGAAGVGSIAGFTLPAAGAAATVIEVRVAGVEIKPNVLLGSGVGSSGAIIAASAPSGLSFQGNRFETAFGVKGATGVTGLLVASNVSDTGIEGIDLQVGVQIVDLGRNPISNTGKPPVYVAFLLANNTCKAGQIKDCRPTAAPGYP